jgi:hypothetical protein
MENNCFPRTLKFEMLLLGRIHHQVNGMDLECGIEHILKVFMKGAFL